MGDYHGSVEPEFRLRFRRLQALEDAIAFRLARVAVPCPDCASAADGKCDDHACDVLLIDAYRQMFASAGGELLAERAASGKMSPPGKVAVVPPA